MKMQFIMLILGALSLLPLLGMSVINQVNLSGINKTFSVIFNKAIGNVPTSWAQLAMRVDSTGKSIDYKWLGAFPMMREWLGDRVVKDLAAYHYELTNKDYEATIGVERDDILDDNLGVYTPMVESLADAAMRHRDKLLYALIAAGGAAECYDGQNFFDTDHPMGSSTFGNFDSGASAAWYLLDLSRPVKPFIMQMRQEPVLVSQVDPKDPSVFMRKQFLYGVDDRKAVGYGLPQLAYKSTQALNSTYFGSARAAMMAFTDDQGEPLAVIGTHVLVGPSNEAAAKALFEAQYLTGGATNPWYGVCKVIVSPYLP